MCYLLLEFSVLDLYHLMYPNYFKHRLSFYEFKHSTSDLSSIQSPSQTASTIICHYHL